MGRGKLDEDRCGLWKRQEQNKGYKVEFFLRLPLEAVSSFSSTCVLLVNFLTSAGELYIFYSSCRQLLQELVSSTPICSTLEGAQQRICTIDGYDLEANRLHGKQ